jgi:hypothetical protein
MIINTCSLSGPTEKIEICTLHNSEIRSKYLRAFSGNSSKVRSTAYELDGKEITEYPANLDQLKRCKPIFEELPGWTC